MKRIMLILSLIFGILNCHAQDIDKNTYDNLVDYVSCKYTEAYIESRSGKPLEKENIRKYNEKLKAKLNSCTPENPIEFFELSELLEQTGWRETQKNLVLKINKKKNDFIANEDNNQVINKVTDVKLLDGKFPELLSDTKKELVKELKEIYPQLQTRPQEEKEQAVAPPPPSHKASTKGSSLKLVLWILLGVFLICEFIILWRRTSDERIKKTVLNSQRLANKFSRSSENEVQQRVFSNNQELLAKIRDVENNLKSLSNDFHELKEQHKIIRAEWNKNNQQNFKEPEVNGVKYLKTAPSGIFNNVFDNPVGCYFKLFDINGNNAKFEFCGKIDEAIANRNAIFDETSEPFDPPKDSSNIITKEPGHVVFQNGKWKIMTKAKIKFE